MTPRVYPNCVPARDRFLGVRDLDRPATGVDLQAAAIAIAAQGLVGAAVDVPRGPLSDVSWSHLLSDVRRHGLEGHLLDVIVRGELLTTAEQREQAQRAHTEAIALAVLHENELVRSVDVLTEAGIDYRVLKGCALAHLAYPNPSLRLVADIDLLVSSADMDAATGVLTANGAERTGTQFRYGLDRRLWRAVTFELASGAQLELHRTLAPAPFGATINSAALFETMKTFEVDDRILRGLGLEELLLQACYSAALTDVPRRLVALRDVAELCLGGGIDPGRVERLAAQWSALAVLSRGITLAWKTFRIADAVPLSVRASRYLPTRREQRQLGLYGRPTRRRFPAALASLRVISGLSGKLAFLGTGALPARSYPPAPPGRAAGPGGGAQAGDRL
ncbi:MAG: nucleotidyltransferase family protein [Actinomycetota bacterium]|nr:nucleotidyltransferase family protein [Actinomycetota bacterium]